MGGGATATANSSASAGPSTADATATGGDGGAANLVEYYGGVAPIHGGSGGDAVAIGNSTSDAGLAVANATATGGAGGEASFGPAGNGGNGGNAAATANATAHGSGAATATATAVGGTGGAAGASGVAGVAGGANAVASAATANGAVAQAQSTAVGSAGDAQSTAQTSFRFARTTSTATAEVGGTATTSAIADGGGAGQAFVNPGQTAYAFSSALPDKAYAADLIGGAGAVAEALLGPRDVVFGTGILGANFAPGGAYSAATTLDVSYSGDLMLGLIDNLENGLGFQSMEFYVLANGNTVLDVNLGNLAVAESFFSDTVLNLGSYSGPAVDLTFGYKNLIADGSGGFGFDFAVGGAVPEPSTWAMMLLGFAGLGFAGYRRAGAGHGLFAA